MRITSSSLRPNSRAAANRLREVGANPLFWSEQLHGVEIFDTYARQAESVLRDAGFNTRVVVGDFFEDETPVKYDAVVGNPPFVRTRFAWLVVI